MKALVALAASIAAVALCGAGRAATPPPLNMTFQPSGSLTVALGDGTTVGSSTAIAPGAYWVTISNDFPAERDTIHKWHLFGPGVDVVTDLNNGDNKVEQYLETLQPSSTYTAQDDYHPTIQLVFRTASSGSSGSVSTGSASSPSASSKTKGSSTGNNSLVGSDVLPFRGSLAASVSAAGALNLTRGGKRVGPLTLKSGRYSIVVDDRSKLAGFELRRLKHAATTITSGAFTGRKTAQLRLQPGRWFFFFGHGPESQFFVVS
jgi:hypothetical protein